ncbi:phenylacetate--CoA ligase family protein [Kiloniella sp.]|uniref:phenylacetate--CoA ligase family protein n=1 Tax=Kiloniella sp. TaxID=1938587 RepID=UPI003B01ECBC
MQKNSWLNNFHLTSNIEHLEFPAIGTPENLAVISTLTQLDNSQWWSPEKINENQFKQLFSLFKHAIKTVPHYKDYPVPTSVSGLMEIWQSLPILERADIGGQGEALVSSKTPRSHGGIGTQYTSGSTGQPIAVKNTALSRVFWRAFTARDHIWHERDPGWKLGHIRIAKKGQAKYPGTTGMGWGSLKGKAELFKTGPIAGLNINSTLEQQAEWLLRTDPEFLITYPSLIQRLAEYCIKKKIRPKKLRQVETISEVLTPKVRELCHEAFGVKIVDLYSTRELGYLGLQCPENDHYHVQSEGVLLEVVDEEGKACPPGLPGKILVTPLHNFAMPLIRYAVGDYGVMGEACSCGRGLPVLKSILGRERNRLRHPDGSHRWIALSAKDYKALLTIAPVKEYQIIQRSLTKLDLNLAVDNKLTKDQKEKLTKWAQSALHFPAEINVYGHKTLERSANGKLELFKSLIE